MAAGCKKIVLRANTVIPGIREYGHFYFREPSIVVDAEFYYKLRYSRRYVHLKEMDKKLYEYISDLQKGGEQL